MSILEQLANRVTKLEKQQKKNRRSPMMLSGDGAPGETAPESVFYWDYTNDALYVNSDGAVAWEHIGGGIAVPHQLLDNPWHTDTATFAPLQGSIVVADATPQWNRVVHPGTAYHLQTDAIDVIWAQNITMADGATIGQAAGPLLTFDDTGDDLQISGCDVLIDPTGGLAVPDGTLHVHTTSAGAVIAFYTDLVVEAGGTGGISILTPAANSGVLAFGSPTSPVQGGIAYDHATDTLAFIIATAIDFGMQANTFMVLAGSGIDMAAATTIEMGDGVSIGSAGDAVMTWDTGNNWITYTMFGGDDFIFKENLFSVESGSVIQMADDTWIGLDAADGRLIFDSTPAPDQVQIADADLYFNTGLGIIHADGVVAGMILVADGTRYVPAAAAATLPIAPAAVGDTLIATAGPLWNILTTPGAAGYARVSTATTEVWDQTPTWTGDHTWESAVSAHPALTIENTNADAQAPVIEFYKNSASPAASDDLGAFDFYGETNTGAKDRYAYWLAESLDVTNGATGGGMRFMVTMNGTDRFLLSLLGFNGVADQGSVIINEGSQDVDFIVESDTLADALIVQGSDGEITLGALVAGFVQSTAGGVLSSAAIAGTDLPWTGAANEMAYWSGVNTLTSDAGLTYNGSDLVVLNESQNSDTTIRVSNANAGAAGFSQVLIKNAAGVGGADGVTLACTGTGFTTAGLTIQDAAIIAAGSLLSGGLVIRTDTTTDIIFGTDTNTERMRIVGTGNVLMSTTLDLDANDLIIDADGDSYLHASGDDVIDLVLATASGEFGIHIDGAEDFTFTTNSFNVLAGSYISATGIRATIAGADALHVPWITGDTQTTAIFGSSNVANNEIAIQGTSYDNIGISGTSASDSGVQGLSTSGDGGTFASATGQGLYVNLTGVGTRVAGFHDGGGLVVAIQDGGQLDVVEYIRHLGDTDTYLQFETDRVRCFAGGIQMWDAYETGTDYLNLYAGIVGINETANVFMTIGLNVNQSANDDEIAAFKSSDVAHVAHGMTNLADTDTFGTVRKVSAADGGLQYTGFTEDTIGYRAISRFTNDSTTHDATAESAITFLVQKKSGASVGDVAAGQNLFAIQARTGGGVRNMAIFAQDGDLYLDTVVNENHWDEHNDIGLLHGLRASLAPDGSELRERFGQWIDYARPVLERTGVVTYNDDGHHFVAVKQLQMLTIDAVRQLYEKCQRYELALTNAGLLGA